MQRFVRTGLKRLLLGFDAGIGEKYLYHRSEIGTGQFEIEASITTMHQVSMAIENQSEKTSRFALVQQLEDSQRLVYSTFWAAAYVSTDLASLEV